MNDYNDGNWHGWNGGKCPVHPESVIWVIPVKGRKNFTPEMQAKQAIWQDCNHIRAFRVVKPYREPREFWLVDFHVYTEKPAVDVKRMEAEGYTVIHVREVIE